MHKILFAVMFISSVTLACAQSVDTLKMISGGLSGPHFYKGDKKLSMKETTILMAQVPEALKEFNQAKSNYNGAQVLGFVGGFMIGWPVGTALAGGDAQWGLAAGGAAVLLLSIPLNTGFTRHAKKAVTLYNHGGPTAHFKPTFRMELHGLGAKLTMRL